MVQPPRMIAVPWFRRESYLRVQNLPGSDLKDPYEQWQERAERIAAEIAFGAKFRAGSPKFKAHQDRLAALESERAK